MERSLLALPAALGLIACSDASETEQTAPGIELPADRRDAVAELLGPGGQAIGEVVVSDGPHGMVIRIEGQGDLPPGYRGAHLHKVGDCSDPEEGYKLAGSHINLTGDEHGLLNPAGYHVGSNFPNLHIVEGGRLSAEVFANDLTMAQAMDSDGFSFILHENEDDHLTQPIGGAGGRIACAAFR